VFALGGLAEGTNNTAGGWLALYSDLGGSNNTGIGSNAGVTSDNSVLAGNYNTVLGANSAFSTGTLTNATAIGANSQVSESNALVLGSINGLNGAASNVNVGFGTTAPRFPLQVERSDSTSTGVQTRTINDSTSGASYALFSAVTSANSVNVEMLADGLGTGPLGRTGGVFGTYSDHPAGIITNNTERIRIAADGNVGIGTTTPGNLLTVVQGGGPAIADGWNTYSSRRWKANVQPLHDALAKVERLQGVSYDLKDSGKHEIGVIAEEVGAVVPEVVSYEENGKDARGVDYSRLTALLIEAVKQQQREILDLESELRATRQTLQKVKAQMTVAQPTAVAAK
jgi:hypothetical protein